MNETNNTLWSFPHSGQSNLIVPFYEISEMIGLGRPNKRGDRLFLSVQKKTRREKKVPEEEENTLEITTHCRLKLMP